MYSFLHDPRLPYATINITDVAYYCDCDRVEHDYNVGAMEELCFSS